jgi:hypothetical protein
VRDDLLAVVAQDVDVEDWLTTPGAFDPGLVNRSAFIESNRGWLSRWPAIEVRIGLEPRMYALPTVEAPASNEVIRSCKRYVYLLLLVRGQRVDEIVSVRNVALG